MRPFDPKTYLLDVVKPALGSGVELDLLDRYLLDADDDDDAAIAQRMADVKTLWDKRAEHAKYGPIIRTLANQHLEAELTLTDPSERRRLAEAAKEKNKAAGEAQARALASWRGVLAGHVGRGGLDPATRAALEQAGHRAGLDPDLVARELDAAPVAAAPDAMAPAAYRQVQDALLNLARDVGEPRLKTSLFHVIGLNGITDDAREVLSQYQARVQENQRQAIGTTATLWKNALSQVKQHLIDTDPRAYIEALQDDVAERLQLEVMQAASDGVIEPGEATALERQAVELGLDAARARTLVVSLARDHGASVQVQGEVQDFVQCPACGYPHPQSTAPDTCRRCATDLFITCPADGCGTRNEATALRCSRCRTDLHAFAEATRRLAALPTALDEGRIGFAATELQEIRRVLGDAAVPADLGARVTQRAAEAERAWATAEQAVGARRLFSARGQLSALGRTARDVAGPNGDRPGVRLKQIDARLAEVEAHLVRGRSATGPARESAFLAALGLAADCDEAEAALAAIPPAPPSSVAAVPGPAGPQVTWRPSTTAGARYAVRRIDGRTGAGTDVADVDDTRFEDAEAEAGAFVRYEISTVRGQARSTPVASSAVLVAREVTGLTSSDGDGEIRLSWDAVATSARVVVLRRADGERIDTEVAAERSGLVDRNVRNGVRYTYRVCVEYALDGSRRQRTDGSVVFGQPAAPPEGVEGLTARAVPGGVVLSYDQPPNGTVTVLRCPVEPTVEPGDHVDPTRLGEIGTPLPSDRTGARDDSGATGVQWYVPMTISGGVAIAGRTLRHLALAPVENVKAVHLPGQVRVTWAWPQDVVLARVVWRRDRQPAGPDEPGTESAWVRQAEYRDLGGFTLDARGGDPVFVGVLAGIRVDGDRISGTTLAKGARAAVRPEAKESLRYTVKRAGLRRRRLEISVEADEQATIPDLVLVGKAGDLLPRSATDGEEIARLDGGSRDHVIELGSRKRPLAFRVFLASAGSASSYQLFDPVDSNDLLL